MRTIFQMFNDRRGFALVPGAEAAEATDEQDNLHAQAMEEIAAEKEGREPKDLLSTPKKKKDDEGEGESHDQSDEQAEDGAEDGDAGDGKKKGAEEKAEEGAGEEEGADDADKEGKGKKKDGEDSGEEDPDLDAKITAHAEKNKMTYAEAKDDLETTDKIIKQYKNDPSEMARAMRNKDREYQKLKTESEKATAEKKPVFKRRTDDEFREWAREEVKKTPESIENFKKMFPGKSENMTDDAIAEEVVEKALIVYHQKAGEKEIEIKKEAAKKRDDLISNISEKDRKFIPDVKAMLLETNDEDILSEAMDVQDAIHWAKGRKYDDDIKAAEERGFKRAKEGATIIGSKSAGGGGSKPAVKKGTTLSEKQKKAAIDMYGNNYDDAECYKMYQETFEEELKKDPNFV